MNMASQTQLQRAADMAGIWWAERLGKGDKEAFAKAVSNRVFDKLVQSGSAILECDYDPFGILLDSVREIGIDCRGFLFSAKGILPYKHLMTVYPHRLETKTGYGQWQDPINVQGDDE